MEVALKSGKANGMKDFIGGNTGEGYGTLAEHLKNKAASQGHESTIRWSTEGLQIIVFWFLSLVLSVAGWWFLISRVVPFLVRCLHY